MAQNYVYPSSSQVTINGIGTPNNAPIPGNSVLIAGESPTGNQTVVQTDANGNLVTTQAAGAIDNVNLTEVGGVAVTLGSKLSAASIPVVIASDDTVAISAVSLPLPAGASTSALQTSGNTTLSTISTTLGSILLDLTNGTQITQVSNFPAIQPVSGTVTVVQPTGTNLHAVIDSGSITAVQPTGTNLHTVVDSGTVALSAGTALVGKVGIDQTTPGVTNGVQVNAALPTGANTIGGTFATTPVARTITNAAITVGTTAVRLTVSGAAPSATRQVLVATPDSGTASTVTFYIGTSTVTNSGATRGIEIQQGQSFIANNDAGDYWIVASVAAQTVTVMEQS